MADWGWKLNRMPDQKSRCCTYCGKVLPESRLRRTKYCDAKCAARWHNVFGKRAKRNPESVRCR